MKHILTSVVLIVLLFPALALGERMDVLMTKDGKEDGPWFSYNDNGQLWWKRTYKDGVKIN